MGAFTFAASKMPRVLVALSSLCFASFVSSLDSFDSSAGLISSLGHVREGKSPLVAATYYFSPSFQPRGGPVPTSVASAVGSATHPFASALFSGKSGSVSHRTENGLAGRLSPIEQFLQSNNPGNGLFSNRNNLTPEMDLISSSDLGISSVGGAGGGGGGASAIPSDLGIGICSAADGRRGTCYEASECAARGGTPMGRCGNNGAVCCLFEVTCGGASSERFVYFRSPDYPASFTSTSGGMCRAKIAKMAPGNGAGDICQFRVDLVTFDLGRPTRGNCSQDIFVISGQNENHIVPKICGLNSGQHYYVGVDESGTISLHMLMLGQGGRRKFDILVTQVPCRSESLAPPHCLQYYTGTHGTIKSFNYDEESAQNDGASEGYPNELDYTICVRKESGFCSISYELASELPRYHQNGHSSSFAPFAVGSPAESGQSAWPIIAECRDDYLVIGGTRLCSGRSGGGGYAIGNGEIGSSTLVSGSAVHQNGPSGSDHIGGASADGGGLADGDPLPENGLLVSGNGHGVNVHHHGMGVRTGRSRRQDRFASNGTNHPGSGSSGTESGTSAPSEKNGDGASAETVMTDSTPGPFLIRFVSNAAKNARGFHFQYRQNPCK